MVYRWAHARANSMRESCFISCKQKGMSPKEIERLLYNDCGLKGLSGISNDVRVLSRAQTLAPSSRWISSFQDCRSDRYLAATMGGLDGFVFTAGVGENAPKSPRCDGTAVVAGLISRPAENAVAPAHLQSSLACRLLRGADR